MLQLPLEIPTTPVTIRLRYPVEPISVPQMKSSCHQLLQLGLARARVLRPLGAMLPGSRLGSLGAMPLGLLRVLVALEAMPLGYLIPELGCAPVQLAAHPDGKRLNRPTRRLATLRHPTGRDLTLRLLSELSKVKITTRVCESYGNCTSVGGMPPRRK